MGPGSPSGGLPPPEMLLALLGGCCVVACAIFVPFTCSLLTLRYLRLGKPTHAVTYWSLGAGCLLLLCLLLLYVSISSGGETEDKRGVVLDLVVGFVLLGVSVCIGYWIARRQTSYYKAFCVGIFVTAILSSSIWTLVDFCRDLLEEPAINRDPLVVRITFFVHLLAVHSLTFGPVVGAAAALGQESVQRRKRELLKSDPPSEGSDDPFMH